VQKAIETLKTVNTYTNKCSTSINKSVAELINATNRLSKMKLEYAYSIMKDNEKATNLFYDAMQTAKLYLIKIASNL